MPDLFVSPSRRDQLADRMARLGIKECDLGEKFILGSGRGGQKINKTSSCVYLRHVPSGLEIKCQRSRSREVNRYLARRELCRRLEEKILGRASEIRREQEKVRRRKRRRSRRQKERMLADKRMRSATKARRGKVPYDAVE